ncbi:Na+/H+ antiporter NhaC [Clostridium tagluense]|uniref:Na+/H+ antiporter NhaC n=1 Tax=Clostridium tagluense TaxID=360422 RepID=UPI001C0D50B4|nr:Na+/H+ antiporter NhaC [Clostridium tagluense]MBU3129388.1 Na+/H+ antiporter NhaC [Clostridium tagluense]MCB2310709.1 Na+/H+ antiporter NhaC [Clostridium tagluense]MCB2315561.1 Na+/H+ antiporter NhaC [Clostridium tagluense]MCB2320415.1 Na+/H+ antiporter NhaC [Clostridium tagluense]MCB2325302.1 Na+/H+ antiporter NhaC [Clostridium tagluense]
MVSKEKKTREAKLWEALIPVIGTIALLMYSVLPYFKVNQSVHIPLVFGTLLAAIVAITRLGYTWKDIEEGIISSISGTMQAIIILAIIGMIIGTWILGGIVPTLIFYGLKVLSPGVFLVAACILCCIVSLATGSSWTTAGTVGIALMGVAAGLGIPAPMAAGAIISGAYFGDKMSPLSDTTNLAPAMAGSNLFDHIRHMVYTTGVSLVIALVGYAILGFRFAGTTLDKSKIDAITDLMSKNFTITPLLLIVPLIVIIMVAKKVPAIPGLFIGVLLGGVAAMTTQGASFSAVMDSMQNGVVSETKNVVLDTLLTRGGYQSMMFTISLILAALAFGGTLEKTGMLESISKRVLRYAKSTGSLVTATVFTSMFTNILAGDQYLSIVLPGKMYKDEFRKRGLAPRNLSRCLEDAGTLTSPLVPWNTCGATMSTYLGVATVSYLPYCFLNLVNPFVSIFFGFTGITMMKLEDDPSAPEYKGKVQSKN